MLYCIQIFDNKFCLERRKKCHLMLQIQLRMAQKLLSNMCANIICSLKKYILSEAFIARHRQSPKDFTRNRKLPFHVLISFLINFVKGSYQDELDKFFQALKQTEVSKRVVSNAALTKARMKLKYEAFIELNQHLIALFEKIFIPKTWHGFRLIAIDGTTFKLPHIKEIAEHFGVWNVRKGDPCPMARVSQLFDSYNKVTLHAVISPKSIDEREQAIQLFFNLMPHDLVLLDRGYPAFWLFKLIVSTNADFCARISSKWNIVISFLNSGQKEKIIKLNAPHTSISMCHQLGLDTKPLTLRLIRIELDSGETEVLITTLIDSKTHPYDIFAELYHKRWPVEEDYKTMKSRLQLENITGKSVLSVYQDFHAKVFAKNLASVLSFPVQNELEKSGKKEKYVHQLNFVQAISKIKHVIALLFQRTRKKVLKLIEDLHDIFIQTTEPIRPGRKFPRKHKVSVRRHFISYKPIS